MTAAEADRDLAHLGTLELATGRWDATLAGIRLRFGVGRLTEIGQVAQSLNAKSLLVVTDSGVRSAGYVDTVVDAVEATGCPVEVFDQVEENPTSDLVAAGASLAVAREVDLIIGLGGGSSLDAAKGINFVATNGGSMADYLGFGRADAPLLPSIAAPTTAGTGSDAQAFALITNPGTGRKMACGDLGARFRDVILDPSLLPTAPRAVIARAGMDAVSHALESLVTNARTDASSTLSRLAWELLDRHFEAALRRDGRALAAMLVGSHLAGAAIEQSMLGAAHATANPLTATYGLVHGAAVGIMLPPVIRWNDPVAGDEYEALARSHGSAGHVAERVEALRRLADLPERLRDAGVARRDLPALAKAATTEWTGGFNPRETTEAGFLEIYEAAF